MGPLELLYGWQAVLCALAANGVTQLLKTTLALAMGKDRRASKWVKRVVLPLTPILIGATYAAFVPLLPGVLTQYLADNGIEGMGRTLSCMAWGAACGQFAAYLFDRVKNVLAK